MAVWVVVKVLILAAGGGGGAVEVTRRLKSMGAGVWQLRRRDSRRCGSVVG